MKTSRRKFIGTTIFGTLASILGPLVPKTDGSDLGSMNSSDVPEWYHAMIERDNRIRKTVFSRSSYMDKKEIFFYAVPGSPRGIVAVYRGGMRVNPDEYKIIRNKLGSFFIVFSEEQINFNNEPYDIYVMVDS